MTHPTGEYDTEEDDIALMLRVKEGDETAFEVLVERHKLRIVGTVAKMLGSDADSEDVAQQAFVRVWQSRARYNPTAQFTTWLLTITRNLVFNEMRRRRRAPTVPLERDDDGDHAPREWPDASAISPSHGIQEAELQEAIAAAIASLPEAQRMAIILRRYEEMPYEEIAVVLETSVPSVKSLLFRARNDLKEKLAAHFEGGFRG